MNVLHLSNCWLLLTCYGLIVSQATSTLPGFHLDVSREVKLCCSLGSMYLLVGRPNRAREVLERALRVTEQSGGKESLEVVDIASKLGTTYRYTVMCQGVH